MKKFIVRTTGRISARNILNQYRVNPDHCIIIDGEKDEYKLHGLDKNNLIELPLAELPFYLKAEGVLREGIDLPQDKLKKLWVDFLHRFYNGNKQAINSGEMG